MQIDRIDFDHTLPAARNLAEKVTEGAMRLHKDVVSLSDGEKRLSALTHAIKRLSDDGINIKSSSPLMQLSSPGNAGAGDSYVGKDTFEISNQLLQDISPENDLVASPFNRILPFRNNTASSIQQDLYSSNYGWTPESNGVGGVQNTVPLLDVNGEKFTGYLYDEASYLSGIALTTLREMGTSDTARRGATQALMMQQILHKMRLENAMELTRIESINKGSFTYNGVVVSSQIPVDNIRPATESLGTYSLSSKTLAKNPALTANMLTELGIFLAYIRLTGANIAGVIIDPITFSAIFTSAPIEAQTRFMAANSSNNVSEIRNNLFHINTIPALQGVPIIVDDGSIKTDSARTDLRNTRPIMWGKTVTSSSFRLIVLTTPKGLSKVGDFGTYPCPLAQTAPSAMGVISSDTSPSGSGATIVTQDLRAFNVLDQKIQIASQVCFAPQIYFPNQIWMFDPMVNVVA